MEREARAEERGAGAAAGLPLRVARPAGAGVRAGAEAGRRGSVRPLLVGSGFFPTSGISFPNFLISGICSPSDSE